MREKTKDKGLTPLSVGNTLAARKSLLAVAEFLLFSFALLSSAYAAWTSIGKGTDLLIFHHIGSTWLEGSNTTNFYGYPPFTSLLFAPLALVPFEYLRIVWLLINLAAASLCIYFAVKLWGESWTTKTIFYLSAFFLTWASFRVTLRNGQISIVITALLLGALLARASKKPALAGALAGLSLAKYPLSFPFFLYFVWKKEWKSAAVAALVPAALTIIYSLGSGVSLIESTLGYTSGMSRAYVSARVESVNVLGIKPLVTAATGGNSRLSFIITLALILSALTAMAVIFRRNREAESFHFAALALFALWSVYHRIYDAVLCIIPAALLVGLLAQKRFNSFSRVLLAGLALLAIDLPGLLTERFDLSAESLSSHPLGLLGLNIDRVVVFTMFWSLLYFLWKADLEPRDLARDRAEKEPEASAVVAP